MIKHDVIQMIIFYAFNSNYSDLEWLNSNYYD